MGAQSEGGKASGAAMSLAGPPVGGQRALGSWAWGSCLWQGFWRMGREESNHNGGALCASLAAALGLETGPLVARQQVEEEGRRQLIRRGQPLRVLWLWSECGSPQRGQPSWTFAPGASLLNRSYRS